MGFQESIDQILQNIQISSLIGRYVDLKQRGSNHFGLCPFHNEKTPSFSVNDNKRIFHCFGCGETGNAISFIMKYKEIPFKEALVEAASEAGVHLEEGNLKQWQKKESLKDKVFQINQKASRKYHELLLRQDNPGIRYLKEKRGLQPRVIEKFFLGYAPEAWDTISQSVQNVPESIIKETGLFGKTKHGKTYDRFREKIIFPIFDIRGNVVAFGSRVLDDSKPKYINSPETAFFKKKELLYGLNFAVEEARKTGVLHIVEGYMDVIAMFQAGIVNSAAPLGTAFSSEHVKLMQKYVKEAVLIFDGDEAGQKAAHRSLDIALSEGFPVKILQMPAGMDPFDFVLEQGSEAFQSFISSNVKNWDAYLLDPILAEKEPIRRRQIIVQTLKLFLHKDPFISSAFLEELSRAIGAPLKDIQSYFDKLKNQFYRPRYQKHKQQELDPENNDDVTNFSELEVEMVALLLNNPELYDVHRNQISEATFTDTERAGAIFSAFKASYQNGEFREDLFFSYLPEELHQLAGSKLNQERYQEEAEKRINDTFIHFRVEHLKELVKEVNEELKSAEAQGRKEAMNDLSLELIELRKEIESLNRKRQSKT